MPYINKEFNKCNYKECVVLIQHVCEISLYFGFFLLDVNYSLFKNFNADLTVSCDYFCVTHTTHTCSAFWKPFEGLVSFLILVDCYYLPLCYRRKYSECIPKLMHMHME